MGFKADTGVNVIISSRPDAGGVLVLFWDIMAVKYCIDNACMSIMFHYHHNEDLPEIIVHIIRLVKYIL